MIEADLANEITTPAGWERLFYAPGVDRQDLGIALLRLPRSPVRDARLAHCWFVLGRVEAALDIIASADPHPMIDVARAMNHIEAKNWDGIGVLKVPETSVTDWLQNEARSRICYAYANAYWAANEFMQAFYYVTIAEELARCVQAIRYSEICARFRAEIEDHITKANAFNSVIRSEAHADRAGELAEWDGTVSLAGIELRRGNYEVALEKIQSLPGGWRAQYDGDEEFCKAFLVQPCDFSPHGNLIRYWVAGDRDGALKAVVVVGGGQRLALMAQLAQIWAYTKSNPAESVGLLKGLAIDKKEWHLRLVYGMVAIEALLSDGNLFQAELAKAWVAEILRLLGGKDYVSTDSPVLATLLTNTPGAVLFMANVPGSPEPMRYLAKQAIMVGSTGIFRGAELLAGPASAAALLGIPSEKSDTAQRRAYYRALAVVNGRQWVDAHKVRRLLVQFADCAPAEERFEWMQQQDALRAQFVPVAHHQEASLAQ
jgi:hypothetical protein